MPSILRPRVLLAVYAAIVGVSVHAETWGNECDSSADCGDGATCVAGDSETQVQRCVAGDPCGGTQRGACPGDETSGQLACIWRPDPVKCYPGASGCVELNNKLGIYKCISLSRCDEYLDGACSKSCNVDGDKQCNDRGTCKLTGYKDSSPSFACACQSGWNGTRCETVVDDSCIANVGQCGTHGTCKANTCTCTNGYSGDQCEIAPTSLSSSGSKGDSPSSTPKSSVPSPSSSSPATNAASRANGGTDIASNKKGGTSALVIIMAVLVALIVVGAILFVVLARRRRRQQEAADAGGFNRSDSIVTGGEARPPTPKGKIVIM